MAVPAASMLLSGRREGFPQGRTHCEAAMSQDWPGLQTVWLQPHRTRARTGELSLLGLQAGIQRPESGLDLTQDFPGSHRAVEPH